MIRSTRYLFWGALALTLYAATFGSIFLFLGQPTVPTGLLTVAVWLATIFACLRADRVS